RVAGVLIPLVVPAEAHAHFKAQAARRLPRILDEEVEDALAALAARPRVGFAVLGEVAEYGVGVSVGGVERVVRVVGEGEGAGESRGRALVVAGAFDVDAPLEGVRAADVSEAVGETDERVRAAQRRAPVIT